MDVRGCSDVRVELLKKFGNQKRNLTIGAYVCRFALGGPLSMGTFFGADINNYGILMQHTYTPTIASTVLTNLYGRLYHDEVHSVNAYAMYSTTIMQYGFAFVRTSFGVTYTHAEGHSISVRLSRVPKYNLNTLEISAKAIIWTSPKRNSTTFYLLGNMSRHVNGPLVGNCRFGAGLGITHSF